MNVNGPSKTMYMMKPYQSVDESVELPDNMYKMKSYHCGDQHQNTVQSTMCDKSPVDILEQRQEDVLKKLENLQSSITDLRKIYNVKDESVVTMTTLQSVSTTPVGNGVLDIVINVDPSSLPYSLIMLCHELCERFTVLQSTFVHSSVSDNVPNNLRNLLSTNGKIKRSDAQIAITLVWKKVSNGPQLIVDPTCQTPIMGEVNIARYITRLLQPDLDTVDIIKATQIDDLLDIAQLQIVAGNSKEKAAAVRTLNATLGKQDWLTGTEPCVADMVVWSVLQQAGLIASSPANVKKWLKLCQEHKLFQTALTFVS